MKFSIVIPTYNHCDKFLKPCIEAVLKYSNIKEIELVISANGCVDNTLEYLGKLKDDFKYLKLSKHLKIVWNNKPLGYAKAVNEGIRAATCDKIVLLNNDAILLPQGRHDWLNILNQPFNDNSKCGITCSLKKYSPITQMDFGVFFCVMIDRKVFNDIGLLDEQFEIGGNEDIDFCAAAQLKGYEIVQPIPLEFDPVTQLHVGVFPLWHQGEGTVHDEKLVQDWERTFRKNELRLALKYKNIAWYEQHKNTI